MATEDEYLTFSEAAKIKGVTRDAIHKAVKGSRLKSTPVQVTVEKIHRDDLDAWEPATYGGIQRARVTRSPGRPPSKSVDVDK